MTESAVSLSLRKLYLLTSSFGILGFVWQFWSAGALAALAFLLGSAISLGNLWFFARISQLIAPGPDRRKPWEAGAYGVRYVLLIGLGYVIVRALGVSPLAVILGLFTSTAAVLTSLLLELLQSLLRPRSTH